MKNRATILYEPEMLIWQRFGGISRYFYELLFHFQSDKQIHTILPLMYSKNHYLQSLSLHSSKRLIEPISLNEKNKFYKKCLKPVKSIMKEILKYQIHRNNQHFEKIAKNKDYDICHFTYYNTKALKHVPNRPIVITVYDMIHELFPEYFVNDETFKHKKQLVESASRIIAISENTKKDLVKFYNIPESRISVVYLGCSFEKLEMTRTTKSPLVNQKYILFVGDRKGYKNFDFLLKAMAPLLKKISDLKVVCAGGPNFNQLENNLIESLNLVNQVSHAQVNDYQLAELYRHAQLFIFPSLYEGFGLPLLEAFHCGCPVACSNSSAFLEIAEDAAFFFDPSNEDSIHHSVFELISSPTLRSELSERGKRRVKAFSWEKTAQQTRLIYLTL